MKLLTYFYKRLAFFLKKKINIDNEKLNYQNLDELFTYYGTDKAKKVRTQYNKNSDLFIGHGYSKFYENHFEFLKNVNFNLLEIGTWFGASTASFCKYFPNSKIFAIDKNFKLKYKSKNISFIQCDIRTKRGLKKLSNKKFELSNKLNELENENKLLSEKIDLDYLDTLYRQKLKFGKRDEILIKLE